MPRGIEFEGKSSSYTLTTSPLPRSAQLYTQRAPLDPLSLQGINENPTWTSRSPQILRCFPGCPVRSFLMGVIVGRVWGSITGDKIETEKITSQFFKVSMLIYFHQYFQASPLHPWCVVAKNLKSLRIFFNVKIFVSAQRQNSHLSYYWVKSGHS